MICPHCHQEHPDYARFCSVTGQEIPLKPAPLPAKAPWQIVFIVFSILGALLTCTGVGITTYSLTKAGSGPLAKYLRVPSVPKASRSPTAEVILSELPVEIAEQNHEWLTNDGSMLDVALSPDGYWLVVIFHDRLDVYDLRLGTLVVTLPASGDVSCVAFSPSGDTLAVGMKNGDLVLWRIPSGEMVKTLSGNVSEITSLAYSPNGAYLAVGYADLVVRILNLMDDVILCELKGHTLRIHYLAFSSDNQTVVSSDEDGFLFVWEIRTAKLLRKIKCPQGYATSIAFSPQNDQVAASSEYGIYVWRVRDGELLKTLGKSAGYSIRFSFDGRYVVCGCGGNLEIWLIEDGKLVQTYRLNGQRLPWLALSPTGEWFVADFADNGVHLWANQTQDIQPIPKTAVAVVNTPAKKATQSPPTSTPLPTNTVIPSRTSTPAPTNTPRPTATATVIPIPSPVALEINVKDNAEIVLIPAGEFLMGSDAGNDPYYWGAEGPQHTVTLDEYWIYRTEVTNAMYQACVAEKACPKPVKSESRTHKEYYGNPTFDNYPVIFVSWTHASSYCYWAGGRLPTEAEWEKAARSDDGRLFPWGDQPPPARSVNYDGLIGDVAAVASYPYDVSPYGVWDMAGNVWEWVFNYQEGYTSSPSENPRGPASGSRRMLRGGAWFNTVDAIRTVARPSLKPDETFDTLGFRCVVDKP